MVEKLSHQTGPGGISYLNMLPDFSNQWDIAVAVFVMPIAVQWWAVWYPGAEPGGGSYIAQRMLASKSERDSLGSVLFFNITHYAVRTWPWLIVALCSILVYPKLSDIQKAFPNLDPTLLGHDIAFPAMLKFLPVGWMGLMVAGLIAANSSTILTHLNWGASYLVHDFYRRFINKNATERHYVNAGRLATIALYVCAGGLTFFMESAKDNFDIILQVGAGTGLLYLLRWFWWRINAWCEVVAMISSFGISVFWLILKKYTPADQHLSTHEQLLYTIAFTTVCWVTAAFIGRLQTDRKTLIDFYRKVRPFGPGWGPIQKLVTLTPEEIATVDHANIPLALAGWVSGCTVIWSALFAVGNGLYGRTDYAVILGCVAVLSGLGLIHVISKLWKK
jgi:Na+/proline symporter